MNMVGMGLSSWVLQEELFQAIMGFKKDCFS